MALTNFDGCPFCFKDAFHLDRIGFASARSTNDTAPLTNLKRKELTTINCYESRFKTRDSERGERDSETARQRDSSLVKRPRYMIHVTRTLHRTSPRPLQQSHVRGGFEIRIGPKKKRNDRDCYETADGRCRKRSISFQISVAISSRTIWCMYSRWSRIR